MNGAEANGAGNGDGNGWSPAEEEARVEECRVRAEDASRGVDPGLVSYVQAEVALGRAKTRKEYRWYANRNWKAIQRFGVRLLRGFVVLVLVLAALGAGTWVAFNESQVGLKGIQASRRERLLDACRKGNAFIVKLREEIETIPDPAKRAEEKAQEAATIQLVRTLVTTTLPEGVSLTPDALARAEAECVRTVQRQLH